MDTHLNAQAQTRGLVPIPLRRWAAEIGRTPATVWRWRKLGWLHTINIAGKQFVMPDEAERFAARAAAGEFSRKAVVPSKEAA